METKTIIRKQMSSNINSSQTKSEISKLHCLLIIYQSNGGPGIVVIQIIVVNRRNSHKYVLKQNSCQHKNPIT